jgi:hypothetical protein
MQMIPLLAFWWGRGEPPIDWFIPIFLVTSLFTLSAGPIQGWFAWRLAHPSIKQHPRWFVYFVLSSLVFYTEFKNVIARTAHIKEAMNERKWKVTPRSPQPSTGSLGRADVLLTPSDMIAPDRANLLGRGLPPAGPAPDQETDDEVGPTEVSEPDDSDGLEPDPAALVSEH